MYCENYKQLSLIAEEDCAGDYCDWSIDTAPSIELQRSIDRVREFLDGGQPQTRILPMGGSGCNRCWAGDPPNAEVSSACVAPSNGGQIKNSHFEACPPLPPIRDCAIVEAEPQKSLFARAPGDEGTWIETERRGDNIYQYLRWREGKTKRGKYLGKVA